MTITFQIQIDPNKNTSFSPEDLNAMWKRMDIFSEALESRYGYTRSAMFVDSKLYVEGGF